jgi:hypothetical protein
MGVELNHIIVWSSDRARSAGFLAEMPGRPAPSGFGHFDGMELDSGVTLDVADHAGPIQQHQRGCFPQPGETGP